MDDSERKKAIELLREMRQGGDETSTSGGDRENRLTWMYKGPQELVDREEYLLGKTIDKSFDSSNAGNGEIISRTTEASNIPKRLLSKPESTEQVDIAKKILEDPLYAIKQKELEARRKLLNNPVKLKQLQKMLLEKDMQRRHRKQQKKKKKKQKYKNNLSDEEYLDRQIMKKLKKISDSARKKILEEINDSSNAAEVERERQKQKVTKKKKSHKECETDKERSRKKNSKSTRKRKHSSDSSVNSEKKRKNHRHDGSKKNAKTRDDSKVKHGKKTRRQSTSSSDSSSSSSTSSSSSATSRSSSSSSTSSSSSDTSSDSSTSSEDSEVDVKKKNRRHKRDKETNNYGKNVGKIEEKKKKKNSREGKFVTVKREKERSRQKKGRRRESDSDSSESDRAPRERKMPKTPQRGSRKGEDSYVKDNRKEHNRPSGPPKLSEKEREAKLKEMMEDAKIRKEDREKNLANHRKIQSQEEKLKDYDDDFMRRQISRATAHGTMADRIKSNVNNIQRSKADMDRSFVRK